MIDTFLRALPHTLRTVERPRGTTVRFDVTGPAGGTWWATRGADRWLPGAPGGEAAARVTMDQDTLWRLATRGILPEEARRRSVLAGDEPLTTAATTLLAVVA